MTLLSRASVHTLAFACLIAACGGEPVERERGTPTSRVAPPSSVAPSQTAPPATAPTPVVEPAPVPPIAAPSAASVPTFAMAGAPTCRVGEAHELAVVDRLRTRVAVSFRGERGLAAWATSEDELTVRPIDRDARPTGPALANAFRKAEGLEWLVPMEAGTIALSSGQLCDRYGSACFQAIALGDDGRALGAPLLHEPGSQNTSVSAVAAGGDWLFAMRESRWGYGAVRYRIRPDGALDAQTCDGLRLDGSGSGDVPLRAIAATQAGRAFVFAEYEGEYGGRRARLYDSQADRMLPAMRGFGQSEDGVDVDAMVIDADALVIVTGRTWFRVGFDGRVITGPERVRERAALPESVRDRIAVAIEARGGRAVLVRRDLLREEVGQPAQIVPTMRNGTALARAAWLGDRFVVVAGEPGAPGIRLTARVVECGAAASPPPDSSMSRAR